MWSVKINAGNIYVRSYRGKNVSGDWLSGNVTLANRISGVCRRRWEERSRGT